MNQWCKGIASWKIKGMLYISVPFTWLMKEAEDLAWEHKGEVLIGGPGTMKNTKCEGCEPILFHNPLATFTSRGCPNKCGFCAVPKIEGDLIEIPDFRPAPVICDNNLLAASHKHLENVVDKIKQFKFIDFNQGLDFRRFTPEKADLLGKLKCKVRFSFDHIEEEAKIHDAIKLCRERTTKDISVYVLLGYKDTVDEAHYRLQKIIEWKCLPNPSRFQPLDTKEKNSYVADGWTNEELIKIMKYYYKYRFVRDVPYADFNYSEFIKNRKKNKKEEDIDQ